MSGISIGNLPNQSILKKINDIAADVNDLDLEGVNNLKSKLSELVAPELGSSDTKAISQKVVTENIQQLNTEVNNKINKVESAQNGNLPSFDNGHIKDSKIPASNIAQSNGYYESMIVGASRNLAGNNIVTAKYTYRPTADTTDVADGVAKISSVKGNTIVWNQLIQNGNFANGENNWNIENLSISNNVYYNVTIDNNIISLTKKEFNFARLHQSRNIIINHKYLYSFDFWANGVAPYNETDILGASFVANVQINSRQYKDVNVWTSVKGIVTSKESLENSKLFFALGGGVGAGHELKFKNINIFDLTQMFGEGNEPTIEEFEAMFPNDYYEYNEGELKSIDDFQIKSVGFNQWDEEWELGTISKDTGANDTSNIHICSKHYIKCNSNYDYYFNTPIGIYLRCYDEDKNYIGVPELNNDGYVGPNNLVNNTDLPLNTKYIRFWLSSPYGTTYNNDICINLSHSGIRNGEYEPYQEDILPINISTIKDENGEVLFPNGLCSAGEAHDELVYDKAIGKWKAVKRIGSVDMGTLNWIYYDVNYDPNLYPYGFFVSGNLNRKHGLKNLVSTKYPCGSNYKKDKTMMGNGLNKAIYIIDSAYTDADALKTSLQGQILYYELAEPIEVVLDNFTSNYKVSDWGTEEILMNSTPIVPVIYDVEYALNAVDTLRNMPTNYISKESLDAFLSALGSAMGGTWTATYNETNSRYDFTFSANATELIEE